jgi:Domain of unknown function (DUF1835)
MNMKKILNITNGDVTVDLMRQAKIPGDFLPWQDVLHEGPVPGGLSLKELSSVRAWFISKQGWASEQDAFKTFHERDNELFNFSDYDQIILWFENDLYDQLQLLQILDWLIKHEWGDTKITNIGEDGYLSLLSTSEISRLQKTAKPVTGSQAILAEKSWNAFCSKTPDDLICLLDEPTDALPFLHDALIRLMEEYPSVSNGLSRTEQQALEIIASGVSNPIDIFNKSQALEDHAFMGNMVFWTKLNRLTLCEPTLLNICGGRLAPGKIHRQKVTVTAAGQDVLDGNKNFLEMAHLDHWIGGVHLYKQSSYCYDENTGILIYMQ